MKKHFILSALLGIAAVAVHSQNISSPTISVLKAGFINPPASAKPGVYWYFMDGNMNKESITRDLEAMKKAGISNVIFLEVNVGIQRGKVDFLSPDWQELFKHAVKEAERLGIAITLGIGPGWTGSGGPWVKPQQSMQVLVSSMVIVKDHQKERIVLPIPQPKAPYFGEGAFTPELKNEWQAFYEDVAVLAYPTPAKNQKIADIDEKALYYRAPYSSAPHVKQYLPSKTQFMPTDNKEAADKKQIIDVTRYLKPDGTLEWAPPAGNWTIMRFGRRNNGAITRPAPVPGLGFEADKFDTVALNAHLDSYVGKLLRKTGGVNPKLAGGLKRLHMDSWEMGSQNWTPHFRAEFIRRRGYDPLPFYPVYAGQVVESEEISERFLWDLRQTAQELILEYHAQAVKKYAHKNGLVLSIEPYDMNPTADLELGAVADVPMSEFWSKGFGFNSSFSAVEATSIAHINGRPLTPAESFTAQNNESWKQYPGSMKNQGDWAFAAGINQFVYHTFQNQFLPDSLRPGATMGPYGVHWDRNQTWWPMVSAYHQYISRCSYLLQQGNTVADVLYLNPEGSPHVFRPPFSAFTGNDTIPDRRGYNFDGCSPGLLYKATVKNGNITFPGGACYRILVLPSFATMTPALLTKIGHLIKDGATVIGTPPVKSPGLSNYPECDKQIQSLVNMIWGDDIDFAKQTTRNYGKGKVIWGYVIDGQLDNLYPKYEVTAAILKDMNIAEDFQSNAPLRYTHRATANLDIYFVSNKTDQTVSADAIFRSTKGQPQLWDAVTGKITALPQFKKIAGQTVVQLQFASYQSFFVVFTKQTLPALKTATNIARSSNIATLTGPWQVSFDPKWGGPVNNTFTALSDWTINTDDGIKYYSGIATYTKTFNLVVKPGKTDKLLLNLGEVHDMAHIKLNGKDLGVVWTAPWTVNITQALQTTNKLEIEVVNRWPNRLIGDEQNTGKHYTYTTYNPYRKNSPLFKSGLLGPVTIELSR